MTDFKRAFQTRTANRSVQDRTYVKWNTRKIRTFCILSLFSVVATLPLTADATNAPHVETLQGEVVGTNVNGVAEFLGIPYAAPPVGSLRWKPPVLHADWNSPLQATAFGPICAQPSGEPFSGPANANEDCLYLNVFAPAGNLKSKKPLPVMFWIYGGGSQEGESNGYDGSKLASLGQTIVVSINYRLNIFGFLAHPALKFNGLIGNYGLLDQQFGLRWVQENIARFGGDPNNITIFGESGGSHDVNAQLLSPLAKGLFQKAIQESGAPTLPVPLSTATRSAEAFAAATGCNSGADKDIAACLRALPAPTVMKYGIPAAGGTPQVADGTILPTDPEAAFRDGNFNHVPIMNGSNRNEYSWSIAGTEFNEKPRTPYTEQQFLAFLNSVAGSLYHPEAVAAILKKYPLASYPSAELQADAAGTDGAWYVASCRTRHFTRAIDGQVPVYQYEFRNQKAPTYFPPMPGYQPLAYHTAELLYLFPGWHGDPSGPGIPHALIGANATLSDVMVLAWTNFARYGNPNESGNYPWPRYTPDNPKVFGFDKGLSVLSDAQFSKEHNCTFWDGLLLYKAP
jgi:para-nitrobenzyl esterase